MEPTTLGLALAIIGGSVLGALYFVLKKRLAGRQDHAGKRGEFPDISLSSQNHSTAAMLVREGGKIVSVNQEARKWFDLRENEAPNIEKIAARIRPGDAFFTLCAEEGETRLALEGRLVLARSVHLQVGDQAYKLVSMEPYAQQDAASMQTGFPARAWEAYQKIADHFGRYREMQDAVLALLEEVEFLLPADKVELCVRGEDPACLVAYQLRGLPGEPERIDAPELRTSDQDLAWFVYQNGKPVLAQNFDEMTALNSTGFYFPGIEEYRSFIGIPLRMGNLSIGALIFLSHADSVFHPEDMKVLDLVTPQISFVLYDFIQRQKEGRRSDDLTNLLALSQVFTEQYETRNVFDSLVKMIAPLIPVEILGFLIYDEKKQVLEGKNPFQGIPPQFIELYFASIPPNSEAEKILLLQETILTDQASESAHWEKLGLIHLSQAASLQETALVPLVSSGRMLGYLQASNHQGGASAFTDSEINLLKLSASQAAPIIENAALLQENVRHAQHTASLRRIANLASSSSNLQDIIRLALRELAFSFNADIALMFLLDESSASLSLHPASIFSRIDSPADFHGLTLGDAQFPFSVTSSQTHRLSVSSSRDDTLIPYYREALAGWGIESVVIAPLVVRDTGIGEIWIGNEKSSQFNQTDAQFLSSTAIQIASLVENSRLLGQTDADLQRRLQYFSTLRRIEFELSTFADLDYLLQIIFDEAIAATGAERGMILLLEADAGKDLEEAAIRSCTGVSRDSSLTDGEMDVLRQGKPVLFEGEDLDRVWKPDKRARSAFLVPIRFQEKSVGLLALYRKNETRFDHLMIELVQSLAIQVGIAISNERLQSQLVQQKQQLSRQINTLAHLLRVSQEIQVSKSLKENLAVIAKGISEVTPFQAVLVSVYDTVNKNLIRLCGHGIPDMDWRELENHANSWRDVEKLFQPEFRVESAIFIPAEQGNGLLKDLHTINFPAPATEDGGANGWRNQDLLLIPLLGTSGGPLGLISLDLPSDGCRPDRGTFETLSLFGRQAAMILESHRYLNAQAENLATLETLRNRLRWDLDQTRQEVEQLKSESERLAADSVQVRRELTWARAVPSIINTINKQPTSSSYIESFSNELMQYLGFRFAIITRKAPEGPRLIAVQGDLQKKVNIEALLGQQNPLRHAFQEGQVFCAGQVQTDPLWQNNQLLSALEAVSMLVIPLKTAEKAQYAIMMVSNVEIEGMDTALSQITDLVRLAEFGLENLQNLEAANTRLNEVNTLLAFNRRLEELDPQKILNNLLETVLEIIPPAEGAWVGLWDEKTKQLTPAAGAGYASLENLLNIRFMENFHDASIEVDQLSLPLRVCRQGEVLHAREVNFPSDYRLTPSDLIYYRKATAGKLPLSSLLTGLKRSDHTIGVLVIDHFSGTEEFSRQDEALAVALTQQTVLALENARLFVESEKRSSQLQALTESTGVIASTLRIEELKSLFLNEIRMILPFDTATLWLREGQGLTIASVQGFEDQDSRIGLSVSIEDSVLFQEMDETRQPVLVGNVRLDDRFPPLFLHEYLSWLGIPMMAKTELIGVIALEKKESDFYTPDQIRAGVTFASQAALSLFNARLLEESRQRTLDLDQRSRRLAMLNQLSDSLIASLDVDEILRMTIEQLRSALNVTRVAAVLIEDDQFFLTSELPQKEKLPRRLPKTALLEHLHQSMGVFIANNVETEKDLLPLVKMYFHPRSVKSVLMIPLATAVKLHGWIWLQTEQVYRFSSAEIDLARTMANQAAIAIQNATLFVETQRLTGNLEIEIAERTKALKVEHLHNQTLLKMINQLSVSIEIDDVLEKTLTILNELLDAEQCFILLADGTSRMYSTGAKLVKPPEERDLFERSPEQELAAWVLVNRMPFLTDDIHLDEQWSFEEPPSFRSVMAVPLILGEQILGTMFMLHRGEGMFTTKKLVFVEAAARQLSIALNNAELFDLARDQSDRLVSMLRDQQIDSSRSFAILEAVADGVLVTDAGNDITLFNASAEKILGVDTDYVTGRSLRDLGSKLKMEDTAWFQTIMRWSNDTKSIPEGANYAQQLDLQDGHIVLVHLAPVILGEIFLGTVSILRDITQEVMVDRLKSDFVANVSHELRTPLTSIKGYADLMLMGASGELTEEQKKFMRVIRENTRRLNILVNDLLDISHIDAGQLALSFQPLDLLALARSILSDIHNRSVSEEKPMHFDLNAPESLPLVNADHEKIRQVLMNLVSNGYHYTPADGRVSIRVRKNGSEIQLDVLDTGIGIADDNRDRIFERFYRGDHPFVLATAGTGLGLAISRILVEMHGGRIWFESSGIPGEGSIFSFTLPLYTEE